MYFESGFFTRRWNTWSQKVTLRRTEAWACKCLAKLAVIPVSKEGGCKKEVLKDRLSPLGIQPCMTILRFGHLINLPGWLRTAWCSNNSSQL